MSKGEIIVKYAKTHLGTPYVWGGESVTAEGGYDCSGLVYVCLNESDIKVSRDTAQGYYYRFKGNSANKNDAGALLFFGKSTSKITHVAIASGDGVHMYESRGSSKNTIKNKGKGVTYSYISRRKDLVAICLPFKKTETASKIIAKPVVAKCTIRFHSKGMQVNYLQQDLNYLMKSGLACDGIFGSKTKDAVMKFQKKYGLVADGIYGPKSYKMMLSKI